MEQTGLLFPKSGKQKKKSNRHRKSIMHSKESRTCYLCCAMDGNDKKQDYLEEHHVFPGNPGRSLSEQWGLKVYLCPAHHRNGYYAVHTNADVMEQLQATGQQAFEEEYPECDFVEIFGKNYKVGKIMKQIEKEDCKEIESIGQYAVYVRPGCPYSHMIKGILVASKRQCEKCGGKKK